MQALVTALGWTGAVACVGAYALVTRGTWSPSSRRYQFANVVGALLLATVAARGHVWPSVASNILWAAIGAQGIASLVRSRRAPAVSAGDVGAAVVSAADVRAADVGQDGTAPTPVRTGGAGAVPVGVRASTVGLAA